MPVEPTLPNIPMSYWREHERLLIFMPGSVVFRKDLGDAMLDESNDLLEHLADAPGLDPTDAEASTVKDMMSTAVLFGIIAGFVAFVLLPDSVVATGLCASIGAVCGGLLGCDQPTSIRKLDATRRPHRRTHLTL